MAVLAVSSCSPFGATQLLPTRAGEIVTKAKSMAAVMFSVYFFIFFYFLPAVVPSGYFYIMAKIAFLPYNTYIYFCKGVIYRLVLCLLIIYDL